MIDRRKVYEINGDGKLDFKIKDKTFKISADDFYQVNQYQIENLYGLAREFLGENQKLLDFYCGSATSSMSINDDHIIGIEINKNAIKDAKENAKRNNLKDYKFIAKNAKFIDSKFIKEKNRRNNSRPAKGRTRQRSSKNNCKCWHRQNSLHIL